MKHANTSSLWILKGVVALLLAGATLAQAANPRAKTRPHHAAPKGKVAPRTKGGHRNPGGAREKGAKHGTGTKVHVNGQPVKPESILVNGEVLAPFLSALQGLGSPEPGQVVRVLQFGDSHTAADYWSGQVRRRLQARFGDGGPGWLCPGKPWRGYAHAGVRFTAGQNWVAQSLRTLDCNGLVGLTGASVTPVPGEPFAVQAAFSSFRVSLLGVGNMVVTAEWQPTPVGEEPAAPPVAVTVPLVGQEQVREGCSLEVFAQQVQALAMPGELRLALPEGSSLLGVELLSGRPGVIYDELGLNGAELTDLERWDPVLRKALLARARPDLIILAYGTNDMGIGELARTEYEVRAKRLLQTLKAETGAPILLVGPLDRLGKKKRQRAALAAGAAWVIKALTQASLDTGCAFWDARRAMGGYGAIQKWRKAGLAQPDLVHLNGAGYQRLGDRMAEALLDAFKAR